MMNFNDLKNSSRKSSKSLVPIVGIGTTAPGTTLQVKPAGIGIGYGISLLSSTNNNVVGILQDNADEGIFRLYTGGVEKVLLRAGSNSYFNGGSVGIGTTNPGYTLHVVGTAGLSTGTAWTNASDIRLKDIQGDYRYGLDEVLQLHTVRYNYKKDNALGLPSDFTKTGFIAQEVQKVIPEAVNTRKDGYLELNVDPIHWAVVNAIKDLYNKYIAPLVENDKRHERDIASVKGQVESKADKSAMDVLKAENAQLKTRADRAEQENALIKSYLCAKDKKATFCK